MYTVIRIPDFPLQAALRHEPEGNAVALVDENLAKPKISHLSAAARASGVCEGMTSAQALSRCPGLLLKVRSPSQENAARDALLHCAYGVSPRIEATGEGLCTLDMSDVRPGPSAETALLDLLARLGRLHLRAQAGTARTPLLACHASRLAAPLLAVEDAQAFLAGLPIGCAFDEIDDPREGAKIFKILGKWGIATFGQLAALGADCIAERLGPVGLELFECASSTAIRPLRCILPPEVFEEAMDFEREIETLEPLLFILRRFLEQIALRLEMAWLTAKELHLRLHFAGAGGETYERLFQIPAPTRSVDILFRMLHTHLENFRAERPVIALHLSAAACEPAGHQLGLFETALRDPHLFYETLARLAALLGNGRVGTPVAESTWRPDAFHMQPPALGEPAQPAATEPAAAAEPPKGLALRRYRPPLPARVLLSEEKPVFITTASFRAAIRDTRGPWRGSGNWWDATRWACDEWDIQTETGELYRLSQQSEGWFVQGELG